MVKGQEEDLRKEVRIMRLPREKMAKGRNLLPLQDQVTSHNKDVTLEEDHQLTRGRQIHANPIIGEGMMKQSSIPLGQELKASMAKRITSKRTSRGEDLKTLSKEHGLNNSRDKEIISGIGSPKDKDKKFIEGVGTLDILIIKGMRNRVVGHSIDSIWHKNFSLEHQNQAWNVISVGKKSFIITHCNQELKEKSRYLSWLSNGLGDKQPRGYKYTRPNYIVRKEEGNFKGIVPVEELHFSMEPTKDNDKGRTPAEELHSSMEFTKDKYKGSALATELHPNTESTKVTYKVWSIKDIPTYSRPPLWKECKERETEEDTIEDSDIQDKWSNRALRAKHFLGEGTCSMLEPTYILYNEGKWEKQPHRWIQSA